MINLKLEVKYRNDTSAEVKTTPTTEVAFERQFNLSLVEAFNTTNIRLEWMYFLAWHAARTGTEFDPWLDTVEEIVVLDSEPPVPTSAAASTTP